MSDDLVEVLKRVKAQQEENKKLFRKEYQDNDYVFCKENGSLYRPNYISSEFIRFLKKNNLPHIKFHALRHTFASLANELSITLFDISKLLGHSSVGTTSKVYTHTFDKANHKAIDAVANALRENR